MGLANIFSFMALIMYSPWEAFLVVIARTLLGAMFAGNFSTVIYSFSAGVVSMAVSSILMYLVYPKISILAVSIFAAVCHNICQDLIFCAFSGTMYAITYLPYLCLLGILSGAIVGGVIYLVFKKLPMSLFDRLFAKTYKSKAG